MTDVEQWLADWFDRRGEIQGKTEEERLAVNYFEAGLIDSFQVIELITEIEAHFDVRFSEIQFRDRRFSVIGGLAGIIEGLLNRLGDEDDQTE